MTWTTSGSILLTSDWQYTEPIASGSFFRLKHIEAPNGGLFAIAQCEVDESGKLSLIDSQVLAVEKFITDVLRFTLPGCFGERRIAIKKLPRQPSLQQELRRLFLPGYLQPTEEEIRIVSRSNWSVNVEVSDFIEPVLTIDFAPIHTKLDAITASIEALQNSGSNPTPPAANTKALTYTSDGDTNGVFYWLGTSYGAGNWVNPYTANRLAITYSSILGGQSPVESLVDRQPSHFHTVSGPAGTNHFIEFDLLSGNKLALNHWTYRSRDNAPQNIPDRLILKVSNDQQNYVDIDDKTITTAQDTWYSFPISGQTIGYRYLKVFGLGSEYFTAGEFEFYGTLTRTT